MYVEKERMFGGTKVVEMPVMEMRKVDIPIRQPDTRVDLDKLAAAVDAACNELDEAGHEIVAVNPIQSGRYAAQERRDEQYGKPLGWAYGYGYSVTDGMLITARLRG